MAEHNDNEVDGNEPSEISSDTPESIQEDTQEVESTQEDDYGTQDDIDVSQEVLEAQEAYQGREQNVLSDDVYSDEEFSESRGVKKRKSNFFVELFNMIENFSFGSFKKERDESKDVKKVQKDKKKKLKKSETTLSDVQKQRKSAIKHVAYKLGIIGFVFILITVAVIMAFQDNEMQARPNINMKKVLNDTTSFGGIDQKDYFLEQNVLDDKINIVEKIALFSGNSTFPLKSEKVRFPHLFTISQYFH